MRTKKIAVKNGNGIILYEGVDRRMSEQPRVTSDEGPKAFGAIVAILAVIGGIAAIVMPMNQTIDGLQRQITETRDYIENHKQIRGHTGVLEDVATLSQRFVEVQTQFKWLREVVEREDVPIKERLVNLEAQSIKHTIESSTRNATQDEQILNLEKNRACPAKQGELDARVDNLEKQLDKQYQIRGDK